MALTMCAGSSAERRGRQDSWWSPDPRRLVAKLRLPRPRISAEFTAAMDNGSASESPEHLRLKRMALVWAQAAGYPVAAAEVTIPEFQFRVDVAAYRPAREVEVRVD